MNNKPGFLPLMWQEGEPNLGEGISRAKPKARTKLFALLVTFTQTKPMRMTIRAETKRHAIKYAKNRWPNATIEVSDEPA